MVRIEICRNHKRWPRRNPRPYWWRVIADDDHGSTLCWSDMHADKGVCIEHAFAVVAPGTPMLDLTTAGGATIGDSDTW